MCNCTQCKGKPETKTKVADRGVFAYFLGLGQDLCPRCHVKLVEKPKRK